MYITVKQTTVSHRRFFAEIVSEIEQYYWFPDGPNKIESKITGYLNSFQAKIYLLKSRKLFKLIPYLDKELMCIVEYSVDGGFAIEPRTPEDEENIIEILEKHGELYGINRVVVYRDYLKPVI